MEVQKNQLQMQKQQAECQLQQVEAQLGQNLSKQSQVDQQLSTVNNKVQKLEQEVAQLDSKLQSMEQKVSETRDKLNEKKKTLADKKAELAQVKLKIAKVKQKQQEHTAYKNNQGQEPGKAQEGGLGNLLGLMGAMGKPPMPGTVGQEGKPRDEVASAGGPINMRTGKPNADQAITQYGPNPNKEQMGSMCDEVAAKYGIPPEVMKAVAWNDSRFNANARGSDGSKGAIHISAGQNPDYDVARGNRDPAYNLDYGGYKMREQFERTSDWKMAADGFYGKDNPGQAMGSQIMALASSRPWEGSGGGMTASAPNASPRQGGRRG